jgi:hypothetical protein
MPGRSPRRAQCRGPCEQDQGHERVEHRAGDDDAGKVAFLQAEILQGLDRDHNGRGGHGQGDEHRAVRLETESGRDQTSHMPVET